MTSATKPNTLKSLEEQFNIFKEIAESFGMDTKLYDGIDMYFDDLDTQASWLVYTRAYWEGVKDADKGWEK